jgi:hypothetical protein
MGVPSFPLRSSSVRLYVAIFYFVALHKGSTAILRKHHTSSTLTSPFHTLFSLIFKTRKSAHYELDSQTIITRQENA